MTETLIQVDSPPAQLTPSLEGVYCRLTAAATEQSPARYHWRLYSDGRWQAQGEDSLDDLVVSIDNPLARWILVLPAEQLVCRQLQLEANERRHYRKLAPYQLEEDIIDDVDELHFVYGDLGDDSVNLIYTRRQPIEQALAAFHARELAVTHIISEADLLAPVAPGQWRLYCDGERVLYRLGRQQFGSVRLPLARAFFTSCAASGPQSVLLQASDDQALDKLQQSLPAGLAALVSHKVLVDEPWVPDDGQLFNLAVAPYYPRLPVARWFARLKLPLMVAAGALLLHLAITLTEWQLLSGQAQSLRAAVTERYRAAVPRGAISDPLKQLRAKVARLGNQGGSSNAVFFLARSVPVLVNKAGVEVKNLQFLNDQQELRLTLQAPALSDIEAVSGDLKAKGFNAEVLSVNVNRGVHQARMKVSR